MGYKSTSGNLFVINPGISINDENRTFGLTLGFVFPFAQN